MKRLFLLKIGCLFLVISAPARQELVICGTGRETWKEQLHLHQQAQRLRGSARLLAAPAAAAADVRPASQDIGDLVILEDADGVVARRNDFNLDRRTLTFFPSAPAAQRYRFAVTDASYDAATTIFAA
jgi:hypothetical protein